MKNKKVCIMHPGDPRLDLRLKKTILMYKKLGLKVFVLAYLSDPKFDIEDWDGVQSLCRPRPHTLFKASENKNRFLRVAYNLSILRLLNYCKRGVGLNRGLAKEAAKLDIDFFHVINIEGSAEYIKLGKLSDKPIIYENYEHTLANLRDGSLFKKEDVKRYLKLENKLIHKYATATIVVNEDIADDYRNYYDGADVFHVQNVSLEYFDEPSITNGTLRFYLQSYLRSNYNIEALVDAFSLCKGDSELYIQGDFLNKDYEDRLKSYISTAKRSNDIHLLGPVPHSETVREAHKYDVGVIPHTRNTPSGLSVSIEFATPNKLYTYASAGLAQAVANYKSQRRVLGPYDCAYFFNPDDVDSMRAVLQECIDNPDEIRRKKTNSIKFAKANSFEQETKRFGENLSRALKRVGAKEN